jgi:hypothetical protein
MRILYEILVVEVTTSNPLRDARNYLLPCLYQLCEDWGRVLRVEYCRQSHTAEC